MNWNLAEFKLWGIDVKVHWSFVLILAFGAFVYGAGPAGWGVGSLYGALTILLLFVCVTLHEYGHALMARRFGIGTRSILLLPIGGVANLERLPEKPAQELAIVAAGPLVNLVLALFNLLPAFPLDGGRLLRALLAYTMSYVQATRTAVAVGRFLAILMAVFGIFSGGISLLLIAFFVYVGGSAELESVSSRAVLRQFRAGAALTHSATTLYTSERLDRVVQLLMNSYQTDYLVRDLAGVFVGVLTRPLLINALRERGPEGRVVDVMQPAAAIPRCSPDADLAMVWELMSQSGSRVVAVTAKGETLGLITNDDIAEVFQVMGALIERQAADRGLSNVG